VRKVLIFLVFITVGMFIVSDHCVCAEEDNIALEAKVEVSSTYNDTYVGENAIDGNADHNQSDTRWLSGKEGSPGEDSDPPHWLVLDFGKPMTITRVKLYFYTNWAPVEYVIQYEERSKWIDIPETKVEGGQRGDIAKDFAIESYVEAQKVRFYCIDGSSYDVTWGNIVRLSEIEVYSTGPAIIAVENIYKLSTTWGDIKR
jgi:hypothetical protein